MWLARCSWRALENYGEGIASLGKSRVFKAMICAVCLFGFAAHNGWSQLVTTATIAGTVIDTSGAVVPEGCAFHHGKPDLQTDRGWLNL
jgi:hypothetical protein